MKIRAEWRTAAGILRRIRQEETESIPEQWDPRTEVWRQMNPSLVGIWDLLAVIDQSRSTTQDSQIDRGVLEGVPIPPELLDPGFQKILKEYCRMRREKGKKITKTSVKRVFSKLAAMELHGAILALETSIANGWTGVFPQRPDRSQKPIPTENRAKAVQSWRRS